MSQGIPGCASFFRMVTAAKSISRHPSVPGTLWAIPGFSRKSRRTVSPSSGQAESIIVPTPSGNGANPAAQRLRQALGPLKKPVRPLEILSKLESAGFDPKQARAILECLELAAAESKRRAHAPAPRSAFSSSAIGNQSSDLRTALIEMKTSLIRWMFFFAVTQCLAFALILKLHNS